MKKNILVIETDYTTRVDLRKILETQGHTVNTCAGRDEAIEYLNKNASPDLIFLSTSFTLVGDGSLLSIIQGDKKTAFIPLARLASADDSKPVNNCGIVFKPISTEAILACVERAGQLKL